MNIGLLDVSLGSENGGDVVIREAVVEELRELGSDSWERFPTHIRPSVRQLRQMYATDRLVAGGSNMLNSHMERNRQWLVTPDLAVAMAGKVVLCGVGWWQYQPMPCKYSRWLLRTILDHNTVHSVRDSYTEQMLKKLGLQAVNTGCPTMWGLGRERGRLPRSSTVVTTVTDYNRNPERDRKMLKVLRNTYARVLFVGMAEQDVTYFKSELQVASVELVGWGVETLNETLLGDVDYFGTRLHAGVRALQLGRTAGVLAIDNRATEIGRDTGLSVLSEEQLQRLDNIESFMNEASMNNIHVDLTKIDFWKRNF